MSTIKIRRYLACVVASATVGLATTVSTASALNPQPLPPGHVIPKCPPPWGCL
jgi:hypothetical protein